MKALLLAMCLVVGPWALLLALWWPVARRELREREAEEERD